MKESHLIATLATQLLAASLASPHRIRATVALEECDDAVRIVDELLRAARAFSQESYQRRTTTNQEEVTP